MIVGEDGLDNSIGFQSAENLEIVGTMKGLDFNGSAMQTKKNLEEVFISKVENGIWDGPVKIIKGTGDDKRVIYSNIVDQKIQGESLIERSGILYKGEISTSEKGLEISKGVIDRQNGFIFEGEISNMMPKRGELRISDNYFYKGGFNETGMPHGKGELVSDSTQYKGSFVNGLLDGEIEYFNRETKETYKGMYGGNQANGYGELSIPDRDLVYKGEFLGNKFNGEGHLKEAGSIFNGQFVDGNFTGLGEIIMEESNQVYRGYFVNGELTGEGEYESGKGFSYKGEFQSGAFHGKGEIFYDKDGHVFQGEFIEGKREGPGKILNEKGDVVTQGIWENDVMRDQEEVEGTPASRSKPESSGSFEEFAQKFEEEKNNISKMAQFDTWYAFRRILRMPYNFNNRLNGNFTRALKFRNGNPYARKLACVASLGCLLFNNYSKKC